MNFRIFEVCWLTASGYSSQVIHSKWNSTVEVFAWTFLFYSGNIRLSQAPLWVQEIYTCPKEETCEFCLATKREQARAETRNV